MRTLLLTLSVLGTIVFTAAAKAEHPADAAAAQALFARERRNALCGALLMPARSAVAWLVLSGLVTSACALAGYDFDDYQRSAAGEPTATTYGSGGAAEVVRGVPPPAV